MDYLRKCGLMKIVAYELTKLRHLKPYTTNRKRGSMNKRFMYIDLLLLSAIVLFFDMVGARASEALHTVFTFNLTYVLVLFIIVRWEKYSILPLLGIAVLRFALQGDVQFLLSGVGFLAIIPAIHKLRLEMETLILLPLSIGLLALYLIDAAITSAIFALQSGAPLISITIQVLSQGVLNLIINGVILIILYYQHTLLTYMPNYVEVLQDEN